MILAACALCGVDEVYRMGGAQAIAALAYGTETVAPVDVIVGPGGLWVQEAKRQVSGTSGSTASPARPTSTIIASAGADPEPLRLDLLAQAEHGEESLVVAVSDDGSAAGRARGDAAVTVHAADMDAALAFAEALAPEHLQLVGAAAEALAPRVRSAGCLFVGDRVRHRVRRLRRGFEPHAADRRAPPASPPGCRARHFRRRMAEVRIGPAAAARSARAGAPIARAEGFELHARSMEIRENPPSR